MGIGEFTALMAAVLWTLSSMIWGKIKLTAMTLNFAKNLVGIVFALAHLLILRLWLTETIFQAPVEAWIWMTGSGLIGIFIGDAFYFRSLQILGPRLALVMATTAPIFSFVLGMLILNEELTFVAIQGLFLTIAGVTVVVSERKSKKELPGLLPGSISWGVWCGIGSAICQALGGVLSSRAYTNPETDQSLCEPVEGSFIRILVAALAALVMMTCNGKLISNLKLIFKWEQIRFIVPATAIGTWLGIWLSQIAFKNTEAAIAQTLMATCPLFALPIVWYSGQYRFTVLSVLGTLVAVIGVAMVLS